MAPTPAACVWLGLPHIKCQRSRILSSIPLDLIIRSLSIGIRRLCLLSTVEVKDKILSAYNDLISVPKQTQWWQKTKGVFNVFFLYKMNAI